MSTDIKVSLADFWDMLNSHDWYYDWSDDHRVWQAGRTVKEKLVLISGQSDTHKALYDGFTSHYFSGDAWHTEKKQKPEKPQNTDEAVNE